MPGKRTDVISWDEFFMRVAIAAKLRSKDPNTQVGACIADTNHRILSVGYNGTPSALNDDEFPWDTAEDPLHDKHSYVIHAEANAIISASRKEMIGATLYLVGKDARTGQYVENPSSCSMCKRLIINAGISRVVVRLDEQNYKEIPVFQWIEEDESLHGVFGY